MLAYLSVVANIGFLLPPGGITHKPKGYNKKKKNKRTVGGCNCVVAAADFGIHYFSNAN